MVSIGFLIGGALINALAFTGSNLKNRLIMKERDMIRPLKIYNELK